MATKSTPTTKATPATKAKTAVKAKAPAKTPTPVTATPPAKATPAAPVKAPVTAKAAAPAKAKAAVPAKAKKTDTPSVTFSLHAPDAHEVHVIGDFNNWRTDDLKAKKSKDGTWRLSVPLKPGVYHYLFLVDGQWWTDPANPHRLQNPFGTENSVITVN